jgi:hypothetical protein
MFMRIIACLAVLLCAAALATAQTPVKYDTFEIGLFEAGKGIDFPPDFQAKMVDSLVKHFTNGKKFKVLRPGETATSPATTLKLTGVVTEVDEGSRAARHFVGFGAGQASMTAKIKFADAVSGDVKLETEVKGTYKGTWGAFGGNSANVCDGLAKQIVKLATQKF